MLLQLKKRCCSCSLILDKPLLSLHFFLFFVFLSQNETENMLSRDCLLDCAALRDSVPLVTLCSVIHFAHIKKMYK